MERISHRESGYDCRVECKHDRKGDHGIHGGRYLWSVRDGDVAVVLAVFAADYPETVEQRSRFRREKGLLGSVFVHATFPTERSDLLKPPHPNCDFLGGQACWEIWDSTLATDDFKPVVAFHSEGGPLFDQPETFWQALEAWLTERAPGFRESRIDTKWKLCPCCKGEQTVPVTP